MQIDSLAPSITKTSIFNRQKTTTLGQIIWLIKQFKIHLQQEYLSYFQLITPYLLQQRQRICANLLHDFTFLLLKFRSAVFVVGRGYLRRLFSLQRLVLSYSLQYVVDVQPESLFGLGQFLDFFLLEVSGVFLGFQVLLIGGLLEAIDPNLIAAALGNHFLIFVVEVILIIDLDLQTVQRSGTSLKQLPSLEIHMLIPQLLHFVFKTSNVFFQRSRSPPIVGHRSHNSRGFNGLPHSLLSTIAQKIPVSTLNISVNCDELSQQLNVPPMYIVSINLPKILLSFFVSIQRLEIMAKGLVGFEFVIGSLHRKFSRPVVRVRIKFAFPQLFQFIKRISPSFGFPQVWSSNSGH